MSAARVLVVDDNAALAENIVEILEGGPGAPAECRIARTAEAALRAAGTDLDLALVDLNLPDGSGTDLIDALRARSAHIQVIIITGDATLESAISAMEEGAFGYILKPFQPHALLDITRRAIDRARLLRDREALRVQLERSEERYRSIIESVPAFVLALDEHGQIVLWNRRLEEVTGMVRASVLGRPGVDVVGTLEGDARLPSRSGRDRTVRWQRENVRDGEQRPVTFAVGVDVTEEREMQRRAVRAERLAAVGTLAAGLAHEVRNPLNSASLQLQVLERRIAKGGSGPGDLMPVVKLVHDEIRRLARLVSDFLAFARPAVLEQRVTPLVPLINGVLELVAPECEAARVVLRVDVEDPATTVWVDAEKIRQVLLNIVRNGIEAIGEDGTITISARSLPREGVARLEVVDDGPGFSEDSPVFDAFFTTKEQGTGLGLAIVHSIVTEHGGTVSVTSQPGATRFVITLPLNTPSRPPPPR